MNYQYKTGWTMAALGAIAGAVVLCGDVVYSSDKVQTKQIVSCILVFWVVAVIRTYVSYVWGFGVAKPVPGLQSQTVGADEDREGRGSRAGMTSPKRRTRRET